MINRFYLYLMDFNWVWMERLDNFLIKLLGKYYYKIFSKNILTEERAKRICRNMFNDIGILWGDFRLYKLIGFADDGEDCYYHLIDQNGEEHFSSMVGGFQSLKNRISVRTYKLLSGMFKDNDDNFKIKKFESEYDEDWYERQSTKVREENLKYKEEKDNLMLASESVLAKLWDTPEEDEAWEDL